MRLYQSNMTRRINITFVTIGILIISIINGCEKEDKLEAVISEELSAGVRNDSLFLGITFGLERQEFFDQCWALNKKGIVKEGMNNMSVEYIFKDSLNQPISFNFYAEFNSTKIHTYKTTFYYYAWAPSHKHFQSDVMLKMLSPILLDWYGGNEPFPYIKDGKLHYYKIDGNRMIDMYIVDDMYVAAMFRDLSHPENQKSFNGNK